MGEEEVRIILPIPPKILSPNKPVFSKGGRIGKAVATKRMRRLAQEAVLECNIETTPWEKVSVSAKFFHKNNRRRDGANYNAMLKGAFDGIVDSGLVPDDDHTHWTTQPPEFFVDKDNPRTEIIIKREK